MTKVVKISMYIKPMYFKTKVKYHSDNIFTANINNLDSIQEANEKAD